MMRDALPGPFNTVTSFDLANAVRSEVSTKVRIAASSQRTIILTLTAGPVAGDGAVDAMGFGLADAPGFELLEGDALWPDAPASINIDNRTLSPKIFVFMDGRKVPA